MLGLNTEYAAVPLQPAAVAWPPVVTVLYVKYSAGPIPAAPFPGTSQRTRVGSCVAVGVFAREITNCNCVAPPPALNWPSSIGRLVARLFDVSERVAW